MKKLYLSASALCLIFAATGAMAQNDRNDRGRDHNNRPAVSQQQQRPAHKAQQQHRPAQNTQRPRIEVRPGGHAQPQRPPQANNRPGNNRPGTNRPGNYNRPSFNHNRPHARPDYTKYRRATTASKRYRAGVYHAPHGYRYQRWSYGQYLPSSYFARSFWLTNALAYGLFSPPSDAVWVRYGPDALLVDRYNGEVISVQYNVFY